MSSCVCRMGNKPASKEKKDGTKKPRVQHWTSLFPSSLKRPAHATYQNPAGESSMEPPH